MKDVDETLWACLREKSAILDEWSHWGPPPKKTLRNRIRGWMVWHVWQKLHNFTQRRGAWCYYDD